MSLNYELGKIPNYREVCLQDKQLKPLTKTLIFALMGIGVSEITQKNAREVALRLRIQETIHGVFLSERVDGNLQDRPITLKDVEAHIGLSTNASKMTDSEFDKQAAQTLRFTASEAIIREFNKTREDSEIS